MSPEELKARTKEFAIRCLAVAEALPATVSGRTVSNQLARSGTSVAANYRAACRARSGAEFSAKLGIVEEEADESAFWLEMTSETGLLPPVKVSALLTEADELVCIIAASRITAARNRTANRQSPIGNRK